MFTYKILHTQKSTTLTSFSVVSMRQSFIVMLHEVVMKQIVSALELGPKLISNTPKGRFNLG